MCCVPDMEMDHRLTDTDDGAEDSYSVVLELAASDNLDGFKAAVERDPSAVDLVGLWFCRMMGSNQMGLQHRTPLMVAATYGSVDVLRLILDISGAPVDRCCGPDKATALHCAASGGSSNAVDTVNVLLSAGADPDSVDAGGRRPADVIAFPPELSDSKVALEGLLGSTVLRISTSPSGTSSPPLSSSADDDGSLSSDSTASPTAGKFQPPEKKEYPVDPSLPDIKNSIYATDEFRMYQFKIRPCSRAYTHDWTECPFVHPGENARRRDPRKYNYSCVPCPDFRKGSCSRGDSCDYAHGVFECWLHPAQYRTRLCKDGTSCSRRVCFFAHTTEELRTISCSAAPTPRSSRALEMEMAMLSLLPGSPSAAALSPSPFSPPISPATNTMCNSSIGWMQQPNVPMLQLPISNFQSSRLRSSLSARDIPVNDFSLILDLDHQQLDETCFSPSQARYGFFGGDGNCHVRPKTLTSSNLDGLFSAEISSSPRYNADQGTLFSPSHKAALLHQLHHQHMQQQQSLLSPIKTGLLSPKPLDPLRHSSLLHATHEMFSPSGMSPRGVEQLSPFSPQLVALAQQEKLQQHIRSLSALDVSSGISDGFSPTIGSPVNSSWPKWDSPKGKLDWSMNCEELERLKASSVDLGSGCEDVSWVQPLVSTPEEEEKKIVVTSVDAHLNSNSLMQGHAVLESWLDQMQLDQVVDK